MLGGLLSALNVFCSKGDHVAFKFSYLLSALPNLLPITDTAPVHSPLYLDEENVWRMDYEDMEKKIVEYKIHAAVFCSPYNPVGRVWTRDEIERAMEIFKRHNVFVVSDEIWSDIITLGHKHIPTQSVSEDARQRTAGSLCSPARLLIWAGLDRKLPYYLQ